MILSVSLVLASASFTAATSACFFASAALDADAVADAAVLADCEAVSLLVETEGLAVGVVSGVFAAPTMKVMRARRIERLAARRLLRLFLMAITIRPARPRKNAMRPDSAPTAAAGVNENTNPIRPRVNDAITSFDQGNL